MTLVSIEKLLNNGMGLARLDSGEVVFVPDALPGDVWRLERLKKKKGAATAIESLRIEDGPDRTSADCPHYADCGGCALLHLKRTRESAHKTSYLRDTLARVGGLVSHPIREVDFPWEGSRIRGKFHVSRSGKVGFRRRGGHDVTGVDRCAVVPQNVVALLEPLTALVRANQFRGEIHFATEARGDNPVFHFQGAYKLRGNPSLPAGVAGLIFSDIRGGRRKVVGDAQVHFQWNRWRVALTPPAFFQSNAASWATFWGQVRGFEARFQPKRVWDVHAGAGFLASALSDDVVLFATEPEPNALAELRRAAGEAGRAVTAWSCTAETALQKYSGQLESCDGALLDPPREGLSKDLRSWLNERGPAALLYISCDMGSFARDLKALGEHYSPATDIVSMNLNPGTLKLETSVMLVRRDG